jgi:hypothetical protein
VKNAKRTGGAGRYGGNNFMTHSAETLMGKITNYNFYFRGLLEDLNGEAEDRRKRSGAWLGFPTEKFWLEK